VDVSKFIPSPEAKEEPLVILASRMLWDKGIGEFIEAIRLLTEDRLRAKYALVGMIDRENPRHIAESQLIDWQKAGLAEWWGYRDDMRQVLGAAHIVVLPTYYGEGLPKVLLEAAACARPIIATNTRGCTAIVRDGENGLLVPPKDPQALAQAISTLVSDPALRARMGARGREIVVKEFAADRISRITLDLYKELLRVQPVKEGRS
jgi:glycosyltransferase involved in cell wall biosynthesis